MSTLPVKQVSTNPHMGTGFVLSRTHPPMASGSTAWPVTCSLCGSAQSGSHLYIHHRKHTFTGRVKKQAGLCLQFEQGKKAGSSHRIRQASIAKDRSQREHEMSRAASGDVWGSALQSLQHRSTGVIISMDTAGGMECRLPGKPACKTIGRKGSWVEGGGMKRDSLRVQQHAAAGIICW